MLSWIFTSGCIAAFAAVVLELFRESDESPMLSTGGSFPLDGKESRMAEQRHRVVSWQAMTDSDLDALLDEFSAADQPPTELERRLAA